MFSLNTQNIFYFSTAPFDNTEIENKLYVATLFHTCGTLYMLKDSLPILMFVEKCSIFNSIKLYLQTFHEYRKIKIKNRQV